MVIHQMQPILAAKIRAFKVSRPPETTPKSTAPLEANVFRSHYDECYLIFIPS
jgi:hypothetical protein